MNYKSLVIVAVLMALFALVKAQTKHQTKPRKEVASYYADRFHGRRMANGERYHRDSFTCAHLKYAFGTILKVRNPINGKECLVKVTDRGPYSKRFTIDLSRAAARHLGILGVGHTQVEVTPYYSGTVPYRLGAIEYPEIPELDIDYEPAATFPYPAWQKDTTKITEPTIQLPLSK